MPKTAIQKQSHTQTAVLFVTLLVVVGTLLLPVPASLEGSWADFHVPLALTAAMACTYIGAAGLFVSSLDAYKATLKVAYTTISVGIVLNALGTLQLAILSGLNLTNSLWAQAGGVLAPFVLSGLALYLGARSFAKLVGIKTAMTRAAVVIPVVIALSALAALLPHAATATPEIQIDIANGILLWTGLLDAAAAALVLQIHRKAGAHYTNALAWLFTAFAAGFAIVLISLVTALFMGGTENNIVNAVSDVLALMAGVVYIQAGYAFRKTREY